MTDLLDKIQTPHDIQALPPEALPKLANEIRQRIITGVSKTGGHLAPSLGVVELTIALARQFNFPEDKIVWDVGHQAYAWKLITGRNAAFDTLRQFQGLGGFPRRSESPYDAFIGGHAGVAISAALGMATVRDQAQKDNHIIAITGDGALTNGISLEAINQIRHMTKKFILIINDNEMSISKNVGAFSRLLGRRLASIRYNRIKQAAEAAGHKLHFTSLRGTYHAFESAVKGLILRNKSAVFEGLGLRYVGPIDGHDLQALDDALQTAKEAKGPIVLHIATKKGKGFTPAERDPARWHGVGPFNLKTPITPPVSAYSYSNAFGDMLSTLATRDPSIAAITAAMPEGTGLKPFFAQHPTRAWDVGICEEHACTFAAGLAVSGLHPFVAIYSTFMQRAVDCIMHDICLQNLPVTLCIDRAGIVGADGPTHHGVFDIAMLRTLPNLVIMQPASFHDLGCMLQTALEHKAPSVIRYPRMAPHSERPHATEVFPALTIGTAEERFPLTQAASLSIWAIGDFVEIAEAVAKLLVQRGITAAVVNARFIKPLDMALLMRHANHTHKIITLENGSLAGGFGSAIREALSTTTTQVQSFGWPDTFIPQGSTQELLAAYGLTPEAITAAIH